MKPKSSTVPVSIIIRTNDSDSIIGETLTCLFTQTYTHFDLLVLDYSSTDQTRDIVKQFPGKRLMLPAGTYNSGQVLNQVIEMTRGEIVVFLNADAILVSPNSLRNLVDSFNDPGVDAAFGRQIARPEATNAVLDFYETTFPETGNPPSWLPFSMPFAAMRRSIWLERPFSTKTPGAEDFEWGLWAKKNGVRIAYVPQAVAMHSHNYQSVHLSGGYCVEGDADAYLPLGGNSFLGMNLFPRQELSVPQFSCAYEAVFAENASLTAVASKPVYSKKEGSNKNGSHHTPKNTIFSPSFIQYYEN